MPQGGTLASVTLSADQAVFTTEGTIDLTATTPAIKSVKKSKTLTLDVENVTTTAESNVATLYMMLAPVDFTNRTLSAIIKTGSGSTETITLTGKNFEAGKAYGVTGTMKDPNGGVTAGSGTYKDGVVSVDVAGNMKKLLGSDYLNITDLKVVGPINGDDIYYLRKMLGSSHFSEADWGKLAALDLSEATIVEGGEWYYDSSPSSSGGEYYTSNNEIGDYMFYGCANLKSMILPENITSIGNLAFFTCRSLISINIPNSVTSIDYNAFYDNTSLTDVYIADLSAWCKISFYFYSSNPLCCGAKLYLNNNLVTKLKIPNEITKINSFSFEGCSSITEVIIPDHVIAIGERAFRDCDGLMKVAIGNGITSIGESTFSDCESLISVTIGNNVTTIGQSAFYKCSITECYSYATTPAELKGNYNKLPFEDGVKYGEATLYVPARCGAAYNSSDWGIYFDNIIEMD